VHEYGVLLGYVGETRVITVGLRPRPRRPYRVHYRLRDGGQAVLRYLIDMYAGGAVYGERRITLAEESDRLRRERKETGRTYVRKLERMLHEVDKWDKDKREPSSVPDTYYERADTVIR
jgi:hypothetical protein